MWSPRDEFWPLRKGRLVQWLAAVIIWVVWQFSEQPQHVMVYQHKNTIKCVVFWVYPILRQTHYHPHHHHHQQSTINNQQSIINHQPSFINHNHYYLLLLLRILFMTIFAKSTMSWRFPDPSQAEAFAAGVLRTCTGNFWSKNGRYMASGSSNWLQIQ
jgi:hypothetical protein